MSGEMVVSVASGQVLLSHGASEWRTMLQRYAERLEASAELLLRDRGRARDGNRAHGLKVHAPSETATGESALAEVLQAIERVAGLCKLFGARRAAVFCADLATLFTQLARTSDPIPADTVELAGVSLLQVTGFLMNLQPPVSDAQFDLATLNALRLAIGKSPLPLPVRDDFAVQNALSNACHAPDIWPLLLQRVRGAQAMLGQTSGTENGGQGEAVTGVSSNEPCREISSELSCELRAISSVQQVLGSEWLGFIDVDACWGVRQAAVLLLEWQLELQFRVSPFPSARPLPRRGRLPAADCLLFTAQQQWRAVAYQHVNTLVHSLTRAPLAHGAIPERIGLEFLALCQSLQLAGDVEPGLAPRAEWCLLLAAAVRLARHLLCWQRVAISMDGVISPALATRGRQLLLRLQLHVLESLSTESAGVDVSLDSLQPLPLWRRQQLQTLVRDCQHFERLQRSVWRRRLTAEYAPDAELLRIFKDELRQTLILLERNLCCPQSDAFCTLVARSSQNALVVGEVLLHEVLEALRQLLTAFLERQASIGAEELALLESLCEQLRGHPGESSWLEEEALASLQTRISRCMTHLQAQPRADIADVLVDATPATTPCVAAAMIAERRVDGARAAQTRVAITQLPVYLAQHIRALLSAAERLETCMVTGSATGFDNGADFAALNRVLIVELRMLATGARALQVYRVARLSAVLAELHQTLAVPGAATTAATAGTANLLLSAGSILASHSAPGPDLLAQLVAAHRLLRRGLNQAAARREVDNPRDIIAGLYRRLDQWQTPSPQASQLLHGQADWSPQHDPDCYDDFRREAEELVESIGAHLGALSYRIAEAVPAAFHDPLHQALHGLHTLKGNARMFACERLAALCHRCESALLATTSTVRAQPGAVAESARTVHYASGQVRSSLEPLINELRVALDELPLAASGLPALLTPLPPEHSIAIPAGALQRIAALVGNARTQIRAALDVLQACRPEPDAARLSLLEDLLTEQERCVVQLDEEVAGSRLVSFSRVTPRLQRLAGRHSNQLDRQLRFRVRNDDLRVDRLLLERLVAPLEHLLRNAIDHGIEPVSLRRACGKADSGTVLLDLQERGDQLVLELRDDGAGISTDALLACAARLGLEESAEAPEQRLQWVLLPGFSTRMQATQDSGHGIGLAMVNSVVTALGGRVEVESTLGLGSCFRLLLPRWDIASKPV
ncbi:MAG: ATP-binding protein [Pseudomonadota bacterium]